MTRAGSKTKAKKSKGSVSHSVSKTGRKTKYTPELSTQVTILAEKGFTDVEIGKAFGVCKATIANWKKEYPQFLDSIIKGRQSTLVKYRTPKKGNPITIKRYAKKYYQEHKEQFKVNAIKRYHIKKGLVCDFAVEEWSKALAYFGNKCAYCGGVGKLQKEHIVPVSKGGGFTRDNIVPACIPCNQSKGSLSLHEWYKYSTVYSQERLLKIIGWMYGEKARAKIEIRFGLSQQVS